MAGSIANAEEDGLVVPAGFLQCFGTPWVPVDRITGVLEQVGGAFVDQVVGHVGDYNPVGGMGWVWNRPWNLE
jgi:hypothetical protein